MKNNVNELLEKATEKADLKFEEYNFPINLDSSSYQNNTEGAELDAETSKFDCKPFVLPQENLDGTRLLKILSTIPKNVVIDRKMTKIFKLYDGIYINFSFVNTDSSSDQRAKNRTFATTISDKDNPLLKKYSRANESEDIKLFISYVYEGDNSFFALRNGGGSWDNNPFTPTK